jgi:hypothetical protein
VDSAVPQTVSRDRAERIARAQACPKCGEYSYKKFKLRAARADDDVAGAAWIADLICGVCNAHLQLALEPDGDVLFFG